MRANGYRVDLLDEFDPRLSGYRALAGDFHHAIVRLYNEEAPVSGGARVRQPRARQETSGQMPFGVVRGRTGCTFTKQRNARYDQLSRLFRIAPDRQADHRDGFQYLDRAISSNAPILSRRHCGGLICFLALASLLELSGVMTPVAPAQRSKTK